MNKVGLLANLNNDGSSPRCYMRQARMWAKEHPDSNGYIVVGKAPDLNYPMFGGNFYRVEYGKVKPTSAILAVPEVFTKDRLVDYIRSVRDLL